MSRERKPQASNETRYGIPNTRNLRRNRFFGKPRFLSLVNNCWSDSRLEPVVLKGCFLPSTQDIVGLCRRRFSDFRGGIKWVSMDDSPIDPQLVVITARDPSTYCKATLYQNGSNWTKNWQTYGDVEERRRTRATYPNRCHHQSGLEFSIITATESQHAGRLSGCNLAVLREYGMSLGRELALFCRGRRCPTLGT